MLGYIEQIQKAWHEYFGGNLVPSDDAADQLWEEAAGETTMVIEAISITASKDIATPAGKFFYVKGVIRNIRNSKLWKTYEGD
jgi:hypothetical protein